MDLTQTPFNVGDRVRINSPKDAWHGLAGVVIRLHGPGRRTPFQVRADGHDLQQWSYAAEELELVERAS